MFLVFLCCAARISGPSSPWSFTGLKRLHSRAAQLQFRCSLEHPNGRSRIRAWSFMSVQPRGGGIVVLRSLCIWELLQEGIGLTGLIELIPKCNMGSLRLSIVASI